MVVVRPPQAMTLTQERQGEVRRGETQGEERGGEDKMQEG